MYGSYFIMIRTASQEEPDNAINASTAPSTSNPKLCGGTSWTNARAEPTVTCKAATSKTIAYVYRRREREREGKRESRALEICNIYIYIYIYIYTYIYMYQDHISSKHERSVGHAQPVGYDQQTNPRHCNGTTWHTYGDLHVQFKVATEPLNPTVLKLLNSTFMP